LTADKAKRWPTHTNTHWHTRTSWLTNARSLGKGKVNWQSRIRWKKGVLVLRCSLFPVISPFYIPHCSILFCFGQAINEPAFHGEGQTLLRLISGHLYLLCCSAVCAVCLCVVHLSPFTFPPFTHLWLRLICFGGCHQVTVPTVVDLAAFLSRS